MAYPRVYGWHRSIRPSAHPAYALPALHTGGANLPAAVDLRPQCPPVYDQGQLGSCTGNALAGLFHFLLLLKGALAFIPSRLMIYYGERAMEGTIGQDAGANGDDGMTVLQTRGVCPEPEWPYEIARFATNPPASAWNEAARHKLLDPVTIADGDLIAIKSRLASGFPVAFGFTAYPSLESAETARTGAIPLPGRGEQSIGGHEVLLVGYDDVKGLFRVRNSWGTGWGIEGYGTMPYAYVGDPNLCGDFRSASSVTDAPVPTPTPTPGPGPTPTPPVRPLTTVAVNGCLATIDATDPAHPIIALRPDPSAWTMLPVPKATEVL